MTPEQIAELREQAEVMPKGWDFVLEKDEILALFDHIEQVRASTIEECAKTADICADEFGKKANRAESRGDAETEKIYRHYRDGVDRTVDAIRALALPAATGETHEPKA